MCARGRVETLDDEMGKVRIGGSDCQNRHHSFLKLIPTDEYGDFSLHRWLWFLEDVERFEQPVPATGHQGFWNWS